MSDLYKKTFRGYLIDHHSPDPPIISLDQLNIEEYERFFIEANINSLMVYCKDHWGVTYYDSKVGKRHPGLKEDWLRQLKPVLKKHDIEFNAYYCLEYDNHACITHPEWRVMKADGSPLTCAFEPAPWKMACYETDYRGYILEQLIEIVEGYAPDSLFLDIFGKSLCYCETCMLKFEEDYGYPLPTTEDGLIKHNSDVIDSLDRSAKRMLADILEAVKTIDPELKVTFNFAALYDKAIRDQLDYQFTEPWAGNWLSAAYSRDTAIDQYPQLGPGDVSEVYNYQPENIYELAAAQIAAQGCRVFMYSGSQHPDGTLEHEEARRIGKAYREVAKYETYLNDRQLIADIGIIQSDTAAGMRLPGAVPASAITRVRAANGHKNAVLGAMKLCDYTNYTWQILPEQTLTLETMVDYKLLILPEVYYVSHQLKENLINYVQQGGTLVMDGQCGLYDEEGAVLNNYSLSALIGCNYIEELRQYSKSDWGSYLKLSKHKLWHYVPDTLPPVGPVRYKVQHNTGELLATFVNPATELTADHWVNWWCPPPSVETKEAAIVENVSGEGRVLFFAYDFFQTENHAFKLTKHFMGGIVENYISKPKVRLVTDTPNTIAMVAYERVGRREILVHVVSNMAEQLNGDCASIAPGTLEISEEFLDIRSARCVYPSEIDLTVQKKNHMTTIELPDVRIHQLLLLDY